ncbi:MAG TPA: hypothetical protein VNG89_10220 [Vicinamibacterales bacterium]|nr:hypothetical protein [Vicinamibacterales bacterium]
MSRLRVFGWLLILIGAGVAFQTTLRSQAPAAQEPGRGRGAAPPRVTRPPLFFREEWKQTAAGGEHPVNPAEALSNANLELKLYGKEVLLTGSAQDENNPIHLWTGTCTTPCAVALRDRNSFGDLTGLARIRWTTKVSGFHQVRPIVKLADGTWLVGDRTDGSTLDWLQSDISLADVRWLRLDIAAVVTKGTIVDKPDLSKVDEIGFVDLMPGSGHGPGGWIDVAAIEVFGKPVKR